MSQETEQVKGDGESHELDEVGCLLSGHYDKSHVHDSSLCPRHDGHHAVTSDTHKPLLRPILAFATMTEVTARQSGLLPPASEMVPTLPDYPRRPPRRRRRDPQHPRSTAHVHRFRLSDSTPTGGQTTRNTSSGPRSARPVTRDAGLERYLYRSRRSGSCKAQFNSKSDDTSVGNGSASETRPAGRYKKQGKHSPRLSLPRLQRFSIKHSSSFIMRTVIHALKEEVSWYGVSSLPRQAKRVGPATVSHRRAHRARTASEYKPPSTPA